MDRNVSQAAELMERFAVRTGLTEQNAPRRYLWTDAFAVCNFTVLHRRTGDSRYEALANKLVERVHHVLAPHRDPEHPTATGLRIGKPEPERKPGEPLDEELEWDRDGQYFHYLTKWMHALDRLAQETKRPRLNTWARELAAVAHRAFTYKVGDAKRMYWKMSVDLSRPQVRSMGHHDPLDGFVTTLWLQAHASESGPDLRAALADYAAMIDPEHLATVDALGIGGLLFDAARLARLADERVRQADARLLAAVIAGASLGLAQYATGRGLAARAEYRLGFRELGLAIGLAAVEPLGLSALVPYAKLREQITSFWLDPAHRICATWTEHQDINDVMLATALVPDGLLPLTVRGEHANIGEVHRGR
jgi:hypothetical protein